MAHPNDAAKRVLIVGRSPRVLLDAVDRLRDRGYAADATNQFDRVLIDYDVTDFDIIVFGGMVPAEAKQHLREEITERNSRVTFVQGLAGIAGVIAAQVQAVDAPGTGDDIAYDAASRSVQLTLCAPSPVTVEAWWATSFAPPEPTSTSLLIWNGQLDAGSHSIAVPEDVSPEASFAVVTIGATVRVLVLGAMPNAVRRLVPRSAADRRLPDVSRVATNTRER